MLMRLLMAAVVLWALFTFTGAIVAWGAQVVGFLLDHVQVTVS